MKDKFSKEYDFLFKAEDEKISQYTRKIFRFWGSVALIMVAISVGIELFWPLPK